MKWVILIARLAAQDHYHSNQVTPTANVASVQIITKNSVRVPSSSININKQVALTRANLSRARANKHMKSSQASILRNIAKRFRQIRVSVVTKFR